MTASMKGSALFWECSLRIYDHPGLQTLLLRLQDDNGVDVSVILYILWRAACGYRQDRASLLLVEHEIESWRDQVVLPLRAARRALKGFVGEFPEAMRLRENVKNDELEAERLQHASMQAFAEKVPGIPESSVHEAAYLGLSAYAALISTELSAAVLDALVSAIASHVSKA